MFTGIVEELGQVQGLARRGGVTILTIKAAKALEGSRAGDSIAVNGACLTVVKIEKGNFIFEAIPRTLQDTNLGKLKAGEKVNLERGLKIGNRLSGHFVTGHIDCPGAIRKRIFRGGQLMLEIAVPARFIKYCQAKGSVAVDGVSLTLQDIKPNAFSVYLIPRTSAETTLSLKTPSSWVNIEFDLLVKAALQNRC